MEERLGFKDSVGCSVESSREAKNGLDVHSVWNVEVYDKHGNLKEAEYNIHNIVTHEGLDDLLGVYLDNGTQSATWYVGLVNTNTAAAATMTYATPVFTEDTDYTEAVRQTFDGTVSAQAITNSASKATYTIDTGGQTLYGCFLANVNTKGDTVGGGKLFCYALFSSGKAVESGDTFKAWTTVTAAHA
jgi:hypothetical protein